MSDHQHDAAHPIPAEVVSDLRDTWVRRLSRAATWLVILLLLALVVRNSFDTHDLAKSTSHAVNKLGKQHTEDRQTIKRLVGQNSTIISQNNELRKLLRREDRILAANGLPTIKVPGATQSIVGNGSATPVQPVAHPSPSAHPSSSPHPSTHPSRHPSPSSHPTKPPGGPSPKPSPVKTLMCSLAKLLTGRCPIK